MLRFFNGKLLHFVLTSTLQRAGYTRDHALSSHLDQSPLESGSRTLHSDIIDLAPGAKEEILKIVAQGAVVSDMMLHRALVVVSILQLMRFSSRQPDAQHSFFQSVL